MKPPPHDWPRISSGLVSRNPLKLLDWYVEAMDFEIKIKVVDDDGNHIHSELVYGGGLICIMDEQSAPDLRWGVPFQAPNSIGGDNTQLIQLYVDDADAHYQKVRKYGGEIVAEPHVTDYGEDYWSDKAYGFKDPEGHLWWICERLRG